MAALAAIAAAQQAEAQNAGRLLELAVNNGSIEEADIASLTPEHIEEIGILETFQQVGDYVYFVLHETPEARTARRIQEQEAINRAMQAGRDAVNAQRDAVNAQNDNRNNIARGGPTILGGRSRRRRRKTRKYF
uniref:Uncharacterized protein n=1 Tax=viral metagenome TaxID=1070528 RepID=A0A6C0HXK5_9ZZZZ